jgi:hypothetical protein
VTQVIIATPQQNQPAGSGGNFVILGSLRPAGATITGVTVINMNTGVQVGVIVPIVPPPIPFDFAYQVTGVPVNVPLSLTVSAVAAGVPGQSTVAPFTCPA